MRTWNVSVNAESDPGVVELVAEANREVHPDHPDDDDHDAGGEQHRLR